MFTKKPYSITVFYSIKRGEYAGWHYQIKNTLRYLPYHKKEIYRNDYPFFLLILILIKRSLNPKEVILFPNMYGLSRLLVVILGFFSNRIIGRVSGGELNLFSKYPSLVKLFKNQSIITLSNGDNIKAKKMGLKSYFIPNVSRINLSNNKEAQRFFDSKNKNLKVLIVGIICPRKGQLEIIKWLESFPAKITLYLIGELSDHFESNKKYSEEVLTAINQSKNEIIHVNHTTRIEDYYSLADLLITNSSSEGMPNVVIEAISKGLPVIGTNIDGTKDILQKINPNLLFERNSKDDFFKSFQFLTKNSKKYKEISIKSREISRSEFSITATVKKIDDLCQNIF